MKNKLTSGYRKRSLESRAINENVKFFPGFLFVTGSASTLRLTNSIALTVKQNRLYKPFVANAVALRPVRCLLHVYLFTCVRSSGSVVFVSCVGSSL